MAKVKKVTSSPKKGTKIVCLKVSYEKCSKKKKILHSEEKEIQLTIFC